MTAHHLEHNGWVVAFAPTDDPQIVVAALYEGGGHGTLAAQLVRDVIKAYFDKQARLKLQTSLPVTMAYLQSGDAAL
jgi:penicillin-binding protein 2